MQARKPRAKSQPDRGRAACEAQNDGNPLLLLPREIRDSIWRLVLPDAAVFVANHWNEAVHQIDFELVEPLAAKGITNPTTNSFVPALLRVCRQIRTEASIQFYSTKLLLLGLDGPCQQESPLSISTTAKFLHIMPRVAISSLQYIVLLEYDYNLRMYRKFLLDLRERTAVALHVVSEEPGDHHQIEKELVIVTKLEFFKKASHKKVTRDGLRRAVEAFASWGKILMKEHKWYLGDARYLPENGEGEGEM